MRGPDILIGVDAGTSVIKAVAFELNGRQIGAAAAVNQYVSGHGGAATQSLAATWADAVAALRGLAETVPDLAARTAAVAVTAQGDGTWLVGSGDEPVGDAWIWLDARSAPTVARLEAGPLTQARFEATGTGLNACQQGAQLAHMDRFEPQALDGAEVALHCKDWLYLKLTGVRATDPSEASFTFGDFRARRYDDTAIEALGLTHRRGLLPPIVEGTQVTHPLTAKAAGATGLRQGTPVCLGYVDMVMTALGAGVRGGGEGASCSVVGSTGVHMRCVAADAVRLNAARTGYTIALPVPGFVVQMQSHMASTLNLDWALDLVAEAVRDMGGQVKARELVGRIEGWLAASRPGQILYHPYISAAGERGPFADPDARASFIGLSAGHRFADLVRAIAEGLGFAMRDCYTALGALPREVRLSGGAARSHGLRGVLAAAVDANVRVSLREETGAAGAAMMAAVAVGAYPDMDACIADWVTPLLGPAEPADPELVAVYDRLFAAFVAARNALAPTWRDLALLRREGGA